MASFSFANQAEGPNFAVADQQPDLNRELEVEPASFALLGNGSTSGSVSTEIPGQLDLTELTTDLPDDHSEGNR